jgi:hypothetical protein
VTGAHPDHRVEVEAALEAGRLDEAARHLARAIADFRDSHRRDLLLECLDALAWLAVRRAEPELAATLVAAAEHARAADGVERGPAGAPGAGRVAFAVAGLPEADVVEAARQGVALDLDGALDLGARRLLPRPLADGSPQAP